MLIGLGHDLQAVHELSAVEGLREPGVFFTALELERFGSSRSALERLAGGFSSKEALFKALPRVEGWFWTDAEVRHDARNAPYFHFHGALHQAVVRHGWQVALTISHSGGFASAVVAVTGTPRPRAFPREDLRVRFDESRVTLRVRPNDLDSLGHVNHATVLEYLETGRWAWMDAHGLRRGVGVVPVVSRIEVDYRREIHPQDVEVRTVLDLAVPEGESLEDLVTYRACFHQQVLVDGGQVAVEARVHVAFLDAASRSLSSLQDFLAAARGPHPASRENPKP